MHEETFRSFRSFYFRSSFYWLPLNEISYIMTLHSYHDVVEARKYITRKVFCQFHIGISTTVPEIFVHVICVLYARMLFCLIVGPV